MLHSMGRDDAATFTPAYAGEQFTLEAGAATSGAVQSCVVLDLRDGFGSKRFGSLTAVITTKAVLSAGKTLVVTGVFEHSTDGVAYTAIGTVSTLLTLTGPTGGGGVGAVVLGCNLAEANRYVRFKYTPTLSASGTDTATVHVAYLLSSPSEV